MRTHRVALATLVLAVTITAVAAASPIAATKQRVWIDMKIIRESTFALVPQQVGSLKRDTGTISGNWRSAPGRDVVRNGQKVGIYTNTWTLTGSRGVLVLRERIEWVAVGSEDQVAIGTWQVVRGTGQYAGVRGVGGSGHAGLNVPWYARFEGVLTLP